MKMMTVVIDGHHLVVIKNVSILIHDNHDNHGDNDAHDHDNNKDNDDDNHNDYVNDDDDDDVYNDDNNDNDDDDDDGSCLWSGHLLLGTRVLHLSHRGANMQTFLSLSP